jgi:hypothetical protein
MSLSPEFAELEGKDLGDLLRTGQSRILAKNLIKPENNPNRLLPRASSEGATVR